MEEELNAPFSRHTAAALLAGASVLTLLTLTAVGRAQPGCWAPVPAFNPNCPSPYPSQPGVPGVAPPVQNPNPTPETNTPSPDVQLDAEGMGARGTGTLALAPGGYLDDAIPRTMFRLRYDAGFDLNRPDRAEFFYATWKELSFHPHAVQGGGVFFDPKARGPEQLPGRVDYQEASSYVEVAVNERLSGFVDIPTRWVDFDNLQEDPDTERRPGGGFFPEPRAENTEAPKNQHGGLSDIQVGFKYAVVADPDRYLTLQFRSYLPTGDAGNGLGTGHVSLEPSVLLYQRLTDDLVFQGQFGVWVPVGGGPASGNVLIYGAGLAYDVYHRCNLRIAPVAEVVGWTVLNGFESRFENFSAASAAAAPGVILPTSHGVVDASGETIVNGKIGVRTYFGNGQDVYAGWGHSLTGDRWYKDIFRVEYRIGF